MMQKLEPPKGFSSMSIAGEPVVLDDDGTITADGAQAEALLAHGFTPVKKWNEQEQRFEI